MARLRTWLALGWRDRLAFVRAWGWLCFAKAALATLGLRRTLAIVAAPRARAAGAADGVARADLRWIPIAARYVPGGATCLVRSLGLIGVLRRRGVQAQLRIGVGDTQPELEAHAWVEVDGLPVGESPQVALRYRAFGASTL